MNEADSAIPVTDPFTLFEAWFAEAKEAEPNDPNAMALATATSRGQPSVRMVLLKGHGSQWGKGGGFVFYTNAESRKGKEIRANLQASLLFHWKSLRRQIRIEGSLEEVSGQQADSYFHSRPRVSQIGSAASDQSRALADRQHYLDRVTALEERYPEGDIPRPPHWTGFLLTPHTIEFWQDRDFRLHDRRQFTREGPGEAWSNTLLYP
ncbi:pyridoxamine 5'-phosphate oxidase [Erythrobacter vulgaris]|uniref:Pyridoxine/pyridoxamine 5'-phosphate oxidase n=1 Tax=Qipengyuania vulgaris TaxID=291985 RepID=A0A844XRQ7_9SPHN|nr:pyridoxamine 5'-phosphate oxidase [Qipengyuania vulgaris]MXO48059.1 pyridoxamine 5'-phosphate oxidase [Qipengyuania vulgaris]